MTIPPNSFTGIKDTTRYPYPQQEVQAPVLHLVAESETKTGPVIKGMTSYTPRKMLSVRENHGTQIFPRPPRNRPGRSHLRWRVEYSEMIYDDGYEYFTKYYRTLTGAYIGAFWETKVRAWYGKAVLFDTKSAKIE